MERLTFQVGGFEVNCSILSENGKAWIVDPGQEGDRIANLIIQKGLVPAAILLTHAHFDHIGGIPALLTAFPDLPVCLHAKDAAMIGHRQNQLPPEYVPFAKPKNLIAAAAPADFPGPDGMEVLETPGHTPGGVCFYFPHPSSLVPHPLLLSGDTLFAGSVGRTDFPGGNMATLMDSLEKLKALPDDTTIIPGHGPHTTISAEKRGNPFLR